MGAKRRWSLPLWRNLRLPYKLVLVYMPLILLPVLGGIYYVTDSYTTASKERTAEYANDLLTLMVQKIDDRMRSYQQLSKQIMTDGDLIRLLKTEPETSYDKFKVESMLNEKLNVLWLGADQNQYVRSIKIETPKNLYTYGKNAYGDYRIQERSYRDRVSSKQGGVYWFEPEAFTEGHEQFQAIRLGRVIRDSRLVPVGTLTIVVEVEAITDIFKQTRFQETAAIKLLASGGAVLLHNGVEIAQNQKQLLSYSKEQLEMGWRLSAQLPLQQLYEPIYKNVRIALLMVVICTLLSLVVTHLLALDLVIPIKRLMNNMKMGIKGGKPGQLKHFNGALEVVEMNETFISVMYEIEHLIDEVARHEKKKKDAEIRVLQNQLSPHFLYNTLNSIRWMAMIQKQDNIKEMVDSLNRLLTYALRGPDGPVKLADEVAMLRNYTAIQKVRYRHFEYIEQVPAALEQSQVLKFLLQPLIENALIHGIAPADHTGEIKVEAQAQGDLLQLIVSDNGIGMKPERLSEVEHGLRNPQQHFGLHSVHERIQLHYGSRFGLTIRSSPEHGTQITVKLPLIQGDQQPLQVEGGAVEDEQNGAERDDCR
ncbi:sensor histidine kinase [Paenibacillus sp. GCM10027626]|uniref:cache domain-containing sensor histidine kinase n=1 Tax=Paenibacillus sp. GCM10027626 TaxID=3273411 RepID=UPI0036299422